MKYHACDLLFICQQDYPRNGSKHHDSKMEWNVPIIFIAEMNMMDKIGRGSTTTCCSFTFTVYLDGIADYYRELKNTIGWSPCPTTNKYFSNQDLTNYRI